MTDQERTELEWRLATRLGDDAWELNQYGGFHEPKPLARSLDALVPLVEAWCQQQTKLHHPWCYGFALALGFEGGWAADIVRQRDDPLVEEYVGSCVDDTKAETLALALDAALAQEGSVS